MSRSIASMVYGRVVGFVPVITGRVCHPIQHVDSAPRDPDESTGVTVSTAALVYRLISVP